MGDSKMALLTSIAAASMINPYGAPSGERRKAARSPRTKAEVKRRAKSNRAKKARKLHRRKK